MITSSGNKKGSCRFLLGPIVFNNSCNACENIYVRSGNKTLVCHFTDYTKNFTSIKTIAEGEQLAFQYSLETEEAAKIDDDFKLICINCGK